MSDAELLDHDRLDEAPHPRETFHLMGHKAAEQTLLDAYRSGRMHHAWIIGGEGGIGKATLAYRMARFMFAHPDPSSPDVGAAHDLTVDPNLPSARRMAQQAHPDLFVLKRGLTKDGRSLMGEISVAEARRAVNFFSTTAGEGGWRIAIVDTADDLNTNAANALLKVLEEPPPRSVFLILSSAPKRLLPTIRSRCRTLLLKPLSNDDVTDVLRNLPELAGETDPHELARIAEAAQGSVRRAAALLAEDSLALHDQIQALLTRLSELDQTAVHALAEKLAGRDGTAGFELFIAAIQDWLHERLTRGTARQDARLAAWAALWEKTGRAAREAEIYNLDRRPLVFAIFSDLAAAERG